ncbi:MAG: prefoldin subunit beta [Candidatus Micrarchaeota archaeon]|nr:prefoldin subunit beta [Candidatus Micrarchaeota archaeon]
MAEPIRDPKKLQQSLDEFQSLQRQLQFFTVQRQQVAMQVEELKAAQDALKDASGVVYKAVGNLLIETSKSEANKDLSEKIETFEVRAGTMAKQEEKMRARSDALREELEKMTREPGSEAAA